MSIDWTRDLISNGKYAASCLISDILVISYYSSGGTNFEKIWIETGLSSYFSVDIFMGKVISMEASAEYGIYVFVNNTGSYKLLLLGLIVDKDDTKLTQLGSRELPGTVLTSSPFISALDNIAESFITNVPSRIYLYYRDTDVNKQIPGVLLIGQIGRASCRERVSPPV